ncbi:MAG: FtsX-like permease family protein [Chloroflexi bacterium]|nr:FtsX-like permease family protein [Chloroflexota bacterium]
MVSVARKNMLQGKGRFAFSVAGVAVAALLLAFILALYRGWSERLTSYLDETDTDLWVVQKGNESFFSPSVMLQNTLDRLDPVPGVEHISQLSGRTLRLRFEGDDYDAYVMGFQAPVEGSRFGGKGGPIKMKKGSALPKPGEIIIDDILARIAGIEIGDVVTTGETELTVVGISAGGNLGVSILNFVSSYDGTRLVNMNVALVNYYLLDVTPGQEQSVIDAIETNNAGLSVFTKAEFSESSKQVLRRSLLPVLGLVVILVFLVGAIVVGLTIYTSTIEKEREFGVMKALGTPNRGLMSVVLEQSLVCCLLGFATGTVAVFGATWLAGRLVPQFVTLIRWQDLGLVFAATAAMSLLASWLPIQRVVRVDPLTVFKA